MTIKIGICMKILIRVDSSKLIGTGHLLRTLTLARAAKKRNWSICFAIRNAEVNTANLIRSEGHEVMILKSDRQKPKNETKIVAHSDWLAVSQGLDANDTLGIVHNFEPDWLVVDHYGLDANWHQIVKPHCANIMVIDDLADRSLDCKILLNQNLGACKAKYEGKVSLDCNYLLGPEFALLRNEFKEWRQRSLARRITGSTKNVLITMGGVDASNHSMAVMKELSRSEHANYCEFTIVVGALYPYLSDLCEFVRCSNLRISVCSNISNMAEIMAKSDLCIGAAGSTSWERCCLGLPTITLAIAPNQQEILLELKRNRVAMASDLINICSDFDRLFIQGQNCDLVRMSKRGAAQCDGNGSQRVLDRLEPGVV